MAQAAIRTEGLCKRYALGEPLMASYGRLSESVAGALRRPLRRRRAAAVRGHVDALLDVSLEVAEGESVGFIGPNGAGKTTLFKLLARITEPTAGRAVLRGRVGSLLEVGTGFHPELTGRENVYLAGAVLGMRRAEVARRFEEIVAFAEVERFLDTPVKRYSSGMFVRLAFSVAAHLRADILLVDEVLAVGDAAFQRKCLGKMDAVAGDGRTVLFVSHNMATVEALCGRAYELRAGRVVCEGRPHDVVQHYLRSFSSAAEVPVGERRDRRGDGSARVTALRIESLDRSGAVRAGRGLRIALRYEATGPLRHARFRVAITDAMRVPIHVLDSDTAGDGLDELPARGELVCETGPLALTEGRCYVNVFIHKSGGVQADKLLNAAVLDVVAADPYGLGAVPDRSQALFLLAQSWSVREPSAAAPVTAAAAPAAELSRDHAQRQEEHVLRR